MGMAYPSLSNMGANAFVLAAYQQNVLPSSEFGFYLGSSGPELFLGGTNSKHYTGDIEYHSVDTSSGFWQLGDASAAVSGTTVNSGFNTVIDSGTSTECLFFLPCC
jgi:cathepsin D